MIFWAICFDKTRNSDNPVYSHVFSWQWYLFFFVYSFPSDAFSHPVYLLITYEKQFYMGSSDNLPLKCTLLDKSLEMVFSVSDLTDRKWILFDLLNKE